MVFLITVDIIYVYYMIHNMLLQVNNLFLALFLSLSVFVCVPTCAVV